MSLREEYNSALLKEAASNESGDDPVWSILPSYDMHTRSLARSINVDYNDNGLPGYDQDINSMDSSQSQATQSNVNSMQSSQANISLSTSNTSITASNSNVQGDSQFIVTDEDTHLWTDTVLDNIHLLRSLTNSTNKVSQGINISVHFTKEVGKIHQKSTPLDPLLYEYKKGDYINGYFLISSDLKENFKFEMFYVLFEGHFIVANNSKESKSQKPVTFKKFLQMIDFSASYNETNVDRLISDFGSDYICPNFVDSVDKTYLGFPQRTLKPNKVYKRFFTFKIPDKLLDSECSHDSAIHTQLSPTLGKIRTDTGLDHPINSADIIKDHSFIDTSTTYGITGRFITKASQCDAVLKNFNERIGQNKTLVNSKGDEFVILKDSFSPIRILQQSNPQSEFEKKMMNQDIKVKYNNLVTRLQEKLDIGNELIDSIDNGDIDETLKISKKLEKLNKSDALKRRQLYKIDYRSRDVKDNYCENSKEVIESYELIIPFTPKNNIFVSPRPTGTIKCSFSKKPIVLRYVPPPKFRIREDIDPSSWNVEIPINFQFSPSSFIQSPKKFPELKYIKIDLVSLTLKSQKYDFPIDLNHDLLFKNTFNGFNEDLFSDNDNFTSNLKTPFRDYAKQLFKLFQVLGTENFRVEKDLIDDLKAICETEEKYTNLKINDFTVDDSSVEKFSEKKWIKEDSSNTYSKNFTLKVNVDSAQLKALHSRNNDSRTYKSYDDFCLVPSFQNCHLSRFYYFKIYIGLNNDNFQFKVPVSIEKY